MTFEQIIEKLKTYGFECEAGPLDLCVDFQALEHFKKNTAEYSMGSPVDTLLKVTVKEEDYEKWSAGVIAGIYTTYSNVGNICFEYKVQTNIPQEWHSPKVITRRVSSNLLRPRGKA